MFYKTAQRTDFSLTFVQPYCITNSFIRVCNIISSINELIMPDVSEIQYLSY